MMSNGKLMAFINALGGGSGAPSAPADVVILPETEMYPETVSPGEFGVYMIVDTPFETTPTAGTTGKLVWGGVEYTSKIVDISAMMGSPEGAAFALGNFALEGEPPEGIENPAPDAPCLLTIFPAGLTDETDGSVMYGQMISMGITPEPPVLSIVQVGAASGGDSESAGGGGFIVNATMTSMDEATMQMSFTMDKSFAETLAAIKAGQYVSCHAPLDGNMVFTVSVYTDDAIIFLCIMNTASYMEMIFSADESATCTIHNE